MQKAGRQTAYPAAILRNAMHILLNEKGIIMSTLALMRAAVRNMQAEVTGAMLVQLSSPQVVEIPQDYKFWFNLQGLDISDVRSGFISYTNGAWSKISFSDQAILGALGNDLLRVEHDVNAAMGYIRDYGYSGPLIFGGLLQPVSHPQPENPLYNFTPSVGSGVIYFVDAVTGQVSVQR